MIIKANSLYMPLKDKSVSSIISSPPYWALRNYDIPTVVFGGSVGCNHIFSKNTHIDTRGTGGSTLKGTNGHVRLNYQEGFCSKCGAWQGQLGLEPTPDLYIEHLMIVMAECWRVLKDEGVCFINLNDTYSGSGGASGDYTKGGLKEGQPKYKQRYSGLPKKSLCFIPERFAIACIDAGWIIRNKIIWHKKNGMPTSAKDRLSGTYETIYMLVKQQKYYFDLDAIREPVVIPPPPKILSVDPEKQRTEKWVEVPGQRTSGFMRKGHTGYYNKEGKLLVNPKGKNPGDVWQINTQPYKESHYATFPEKLVERMMLCSTAQGDIVLDPFGGSGTVARVAVKYQRKPILFDLGYHHLQKKRVNNVQINLCLFQPNIWGFCHEE